jgi:hypothetical protein
MTTRHLASVSLDLDDLWTYLKVRGDARWQERPTYLPTFVPLMLDTLDALGLRITVFIVGADAARPELRPLFQSIVARGHEVANHSHEHESWLHTYNDEQLRSELDRAEAAIVEATGQRPRGFRGPGYSWSPALLEMLAERGYEYDASTLPTFIGPLARWYYFRTAGLSREARETRRLLFGSWRDGLRPLRAHRLQLPSGRELLEIPVTTVPVVRTPFHPSYLLYLSRQSEALMRAYLRSGLALCRLRRVEPSVLLHPLDFLGKGDVDGLEFFPGMDLSGTKKRALLRTAIEMLQERHDVRTMSGHAEALRGRRLATHHVSKER